jgi:hypothetical protein
MKTSVIWALVLAMNVAACNSESESTSFERSYQYSYNGCDTGKHQFTSLSSFCAGLKDYRRNNNGCAYSIRKYAFEEAGCSGVFQEENI